MIRNLILLILLQHPSLHFSLILRHSLSLRFSLILNRNLFSRFSLSRSLTFYCVNHSLLLFYFSILFMNNFRGRAYMNLHMIYGRKIFNHQGNRFF